MSEPQPIPQPREPTTPSGNPLPEGFPVPEPSAHPDFGPDVAASEGVEMPKVNQKNRPKSTNNVFGKLGQNRKRNSGVRQLVAEDQDKIADFYATVAVGVMMFRPTTAEALANNADACAEAWMKVARENDRVRRVLLRFIEGGVWGGLLAAHGPILMTMVPDNMPDRIRNMFARKETVEVPDDISGLDNA